MNNNLFGILVDPARTADLAFFRSEVAAILDYMRGSPPRRSNAPVLTAGEPERAAQADRRSHGIPVDDGTWGSLVAAAKAVGVPI
ncbi:MAG: hypothetical protein FJX57_02870 [Alphaproteobacteria bacterium]|nr:hypothetical protein [Alphaproteobacteria bacterium]